MKKMLLCLVLVACSGLVWGDEAKTATADGGLVYTTSGDVEPGVWTGQYKKAKSLADGQGIPLVAFWSNPGCAYCKALQRVVKTTAVTSWFQKRGYLLVFGYGTSGENADIKSFARIGSAFPYLAFYWKKPGKTAAKTRYCGRLNADSYALPPTGLGVANTLANRFLAAAQLHFPDPVLTLVTVGDGTGTVKGGGPYFRETPVTLTATPATRNVFAGWYADKALKVPYPDATACRSTKLTYVTTTNDVTLYAWFVTAATDAASLSIGTKDAYETGTNGIFELAVPVSSLSVPKLAVKGLPSGLKFDTKTGAITGAAKKPGIYTVTVSATNKSQTKAIAKTFLLRVPNFVSPNLPCLLPEMDAYTISVGVPQTDLLDLLTTDGYAVSSVSGLPSGLTFNRKTGLVAGVPTRAGFFTVTVTAKKERVTTTATVTVVVTALPEWAVGTFNGARISGEAADGLLTLSLGKTGNISGKIQSMGTNWTVSAKSLTAVDLEKGVISADVLVKAGKRAWTNRLVIVESATLPGQGVLQGTTEDDGLAWMARLNLWKTSPWKDEAKILAKAPLLESSDGVTVKMKSDGAATAKYLTYSCSTVLLPKENGKFEIFVYFPPKKTSRMTFDGFSARYDLHTGGSGIDWED